MTRRTACLYALALLCPLLAFLWQRSSAACAREVQAAFSSASAAAVARGQPPHPAEDHERAAAARRCTRSNQLVSSAALVLSFGCIMGASALQRASRSPLFLAAHAACICAALACIAGGAFQRARQSALIEADLARASQLRAQQVAPFEIHSLTGDAARFQRLARDSQLAALTLGCIGAALFAVAAVRAAPHAPAHHPRQLPHT
ncbi:MAG: hypothetical protein SFZ24_09370 [Planctomycetota bacterium]|nr:hypothetical protein [Planctomycetota bacterium]